MSILIPSAISALVLGAICCPLVAPATQGLIDGTGAGAIRDLDAKLIIDWWLSGGAVASPTGTATVLAALFLASLLFFASEAAKERDEDGGVLGNARLKRGVEAVKGSMTWDGKTSPAGRGLVYGFFRGKYLFEPGRFSLIDGSTGSGKSRFILIPTLDLLTNGDGSNGSEPHTVIVSDVKNEMIELCGSELENRGYKVLLLDTQGPMKGHRYNPLSSIVLFAERGMLQEAEQAADSIASVIVPDERGGGSSHWTESARSLLSALVLTVALHQECPVEAKNLATVNEILCRGTEGEGVDPANGLKALIRELPADHPARDRASQFLSSGGNEMRSILSTLKARMRIFSSTPIAWMISGDDIDPDLIIREKTAVFLHVLDEASPYNAILTIFLDSLWTSARIAAESNGGSLERPVTIIGDEWGNLPTVRSLPSILSLGRSYGLFWHGAVQNVAQLNKYGERDGRPKILANCGVKVALKLGEEEDRRYFTELVGKTTRHTRGTSTSRGSNGGGGSTSYSEHADDLIHTWEWTTRSPDKDGAVVIKTAENGVPSSRAGAFQTPLVDCTKTPTKAHFDLGTRQHERSKRLAYQLALEERAQAHKGDDVPVWCPEFPKPTEPDIEDDDWGSL